jgi:hypothetical protein
MFLDIEPTPSDMPPKPEPRFRTLGYIATGISGLAGVGFEMMGTHPILGKVLIVLSAIWATVEIYRADEVESIRPAVRGAFIVVVWVFVFVFIGPETVEMAKKKQPAEVVAVYSPNPAPVSGPTNVSTDSKLPSPTTSAANSKKKSAEPKRKTYCDISEDEQDLLSNLSESNLRQRDEIDARFLNEAHSKWDHADIKLDIERQGATPKEMKIIEQEHIESVKHLIQDNRARVCEAMALKKASLARFGAGDDDVRRLQGAIGPFADMADYSGRR